MGGGWIKAHRRLLQHWLSERSDWLGAWMIILLEVNHAPGTVVIDGQPIHLDRGQSARSKASWAQLFGRGWDRMRVRRFLSLLEAEGMVTTTPHRRTTILTVCNYSTYQDSRPPERPPERPPHENQGMLREKVKTDRPPQCSKTDHQNDHQIDHINASDGKDLGENVTTRSTTRTTGSRPPERPHSDHKQEEREVQEEKEGGGRARAPEAAAAASPAPGTTMDQILQACGMARGHGATAEVAGLLQAVLAAEQTPDTMEARESLLTELVTTARALGRTRVRWARDLDDAVEARRQQQERRELAAVRRRIEESSEDEAAERERIDAWHRECLPAAERLVAELDPDSLDQRGREMLDLLRRTVESPKQRVGFALTSLQRHLERPDPEDPDPDGPEGAPHPILDPATPLPPRAQAEVGREVRAARVEAGLEDDDAINADLALAGDDDAGEDYAPHVDTDAETQPHARPDVPAEDHDHDTVEVEPDGSIW